MKNKESSLDREYTTFIHIDISEYPSYGCALIRKMTTDDNKDEANFFIVSLAFLKSHKSLIELGRVPPNEQYLVVTPEYFNHYYNGCRWQRNVWDMTVPISNEDYYFIKRTLNENKFDKKLIVLDWSGNNGLFYDLERKPVRRKISMSYIETRPRFLSSSLAQEALEKISKNKKVSDAEVVEIPYYNRSDDERYGLEFLYLPGEKEFQKFAISGYKDLDRKIEKERGTFMPGGIDWNFHEHIRKEAFGSVKKEEE